MGSSSSRNYNVNVETIIKALNAVLISKHHTQLVVTSRNGSSMIFPATLSECKEFIDALKLNSYLKYGEEIPDEKLEHSSEIMDWAADLAAEFNVTSMDDYIYCIKLIKCRYNDWKDGLFFDRREHYFKQYCEELRALINQYHRAYDISKPQFGSALSAASNYVQYGKRLRCSTLEEYTKRAQEAYKKGCRKETWRLPDGGICKTYINWNSQGVYCKRNNLVTIDKFFGKRNHFWMLLYKKWPVAVLIVAFIFFLLVINI